MFSCYVFTTDARLLLTMRGRTKPTLPGVWANSCTEHTAPGESLPGAAVRAMGRELGLPATFPTLVLPNFRYGHKPCPVYRVVTDDQPHPDPALVGDFEWVPWQDFVYAVVTGEVSVAPWTRAQVPILTQLGDDPSSWPATPTLPVKALPRVS